MEASSQDHAVKPTVPPSPLDTMKPPPPPTAGMPPPPPPPPPLNPREYVTKILSRLPKGKMMSRSDVK